MLAWLLRSKSLIRGDVLLDTILFRFRSLMERRSRYTSASSSRTMASQSLAFLKNLSKLGSSSSGSWPKSAAVILSRGRWVNSATDSLFRSALCHVVAVCESGNMAANLTMSEYDHHL